MANNNFKDSVYIPVVQAVVTGSLSGIFGGTCAALMRLSHPWLYGAALGACAALVSWLEYRGRWQWILERLLNIDLNHDTVIGEPKEPYQEPRTGPVSVVVVSDDGRNGDYIDLPAKQEQLRQLADGLQSGRAFSLAAWTGYRAPFSRSEFETLRAELLKRGLARWRNDGAPGQGVELTGAGRAVLRHFASVTALPHTVSDGRE